MWDDNGQRQGEAPKHLPSLSSFGTKTIGTIVRVCSPQEGDSFRGLSRLYQEGNTFCTCTAWDQSLIMNDLAPALPSPQPAETISSLAGSKPYTNGSRASYLRLRDGPESCKLCNKEERVLRFYGNDSFRPCKNVTLRDTRLFRTSAPHKKPAVALLMPSSAMFMGDYSIWFMQT